jgi:DNA-binding NarL/FixJ family response regulator
LGEPTPAAGAILIVDSDRHGRRHVAELLQRVGFETCELGTGEGVLAACAEARPALVILEVPLPELNGYEVCRQLRETHGETIPILFLTGERTESFDKVAGLLVGADDYVVKPFDPAELIARVRRLTARAAVDPPSRRAPIPAELGALTQRENEVLKLLTQGYRQSEIARDLYISPRTVATHIQHILKKLDVHDRTQAVALTLQRGPVGGLPTP